MISAHAGLILFTEGTVLVGGKLYSPARGRWSQVPENATLETGEGRAEVLLAPGVYLRLGPQTGMRLISNKLFDVRVEFITGSIIVEAASLQPDNAVLFLYHEQQIRVADKSTYRLDSDPAQIVVNSGRVELNRDEAVLAVAANQLFSFESGSVKAVPQESQLDPFGRWSQERHRVENPTAPLTPPEGWKKRLARLWALPLATVPGS